MTRPKTDFWRFFMELLFFFYSFTAYTSATRFIHRQNFFTSTSNEEEAEDYSLGSALNLWAILGLLFVVAISVTICATYLVPIIGPVASALHTSKTFVRFIFIPLATNAGSLGTAIITGYCGGLDLAIYNVFQNAMQIALFIIPSMVVSEWVVNVRMTMDFRTLGAVMFFTSVLVVNYLVQTGKGSHLGGLMCITTWVLRIFRMSEW